METTKQQEPPAKGPVTLSEYDAYLASLKEEKILIEQELSSKYGNVAYRDAHRKCVWQGDREGLSEHQSKQNWFKIQERLDSGRGHLLERLRSVNGKIVGVKSTIADLRAEAVREKARQTQEDRQADWVHTPSFQAMIDLLTEIRDELRKIRERQP